MLDVWILEVGMIDAPLEWLTNGGGTTGPWGPGGPFPLPVLPRVAAAASLEIEKVHTVCFLFNWQVFVQKKVMQKLRKKQGL